MWPALSQQKPARQEAATEPSCHQRGLIPQHQQFMSAPFRKRDGSHARIKKLHVERIWRVNFDDRADLARGKPLFWLVLKECHDIEQFYRPGLHADTIYANSTLSFRPSARAAFSRS